MSLNAVGVKNVPRADRRVGNALSELREDQGQGGNAQYQQRNPATDNGGVSDPVTGNRYYHRHKREHHYHSRQKRQNVFALPLKAGEQQRNNGKRARTEQANHAA